MIKAVRVFRLTNGEDVVADATYSPETRSWTLENPMRIIYNTELFGETGGTEMADTMGQSVMLLAPWLMPSIVRGNSVTISETQILFNADITDKVHNYYDKITKIFDMLKAGKRLTAADFGVNTDDADFSMELGEEESSDANNTVDLDILKKKAGRLLH